MPVCTRRPQAAGNCAHLQRQAEDHAEAGGGDGVVWSDGERWPRADGRLVAWRRRAIDRRPLQGVIIARRQRLHIRATRYGECSASGDCRLPLFPNFVSHFSRFNAMKMKSFADLGSMKAQYESVVVMQMTHWDFENTGLLLNQSFSPPLCVWASITVYER